MSAYLWPMSRQTVLDLNGDLVAGAWLNFWVAGTTTPLVVYQDSALSTPHPNVIEADTAGRFPAVYMPYTDYRQRVRTPGGVLLFDDDGIALPEPASSGGGGSVPEAQLLQTGDIMSTFATGARAGFVRLNALTIGNAGSGATERANADTAALFVWLWDRLLDSLAPVSGGRGASGAADYAAGKTLQLPNGRDKSLFGVDGMGGGLAGGFAGVGITGGTDVPGSFGGAALHTLTNGQIAAHSHTGTTNNASPNNPTYINFPNSVSVSVGAGLSVPDFGTATSVQVSGSLSHSHTFTTNSEGGGQAHNNMPPFLLVTHYIKL